MNLSLKQRIVISFVIAVVSILVLSLINFFYLEDLHKTINQKTFQLKNEANSIHEMTNNYFQLRISVSKMLQESGPSNAKLMSEVDLILKSLEEQIIKNSTNIHNQEIQSALKKLSFNIISLRDLLAQFYISAQKEKERGNVRQASLEAYLDGMWSDYNTLHNALYVATKQREREIDLSVNETKRVMLIILIIGFLALILVAMVIPAKVTLPFKKIGDAIRELQDCNFDVSIYYNQNDEIGEIARELNKMIHNIKNFEELRADRISVELRKFDILANVVKKYVVVANAKAEIVYVNGPLYSLLNLSSEDLLHKNIEEVLLPDSIKEGIELAIKRRTKVENIEISIYHQISHLTTDHNDLSKSEDVIHGEVVDVTEKLTTELIFEGFANIFPIRGKDSSQDYYLMLISKEVFV